MREVILTRDGSRPYLIRYVLLRTPWLQIYLHNFKLPDEDLELHDHPYDMGSIVLLGGYLEERVDSVKVRKAGSFGYSKAEELHRVAKLLPNTWTLFFGGPRKREWGFMTETGWKPWRQHLSDKQKERA